MSRYDRVNPRCALDPVRSMRLIGRTETGRLTVIRVLDVERGNVYFYRRLRGAGTWPFGRMGMLDWQAAVAVEWNRIIAVRLPKIRAGSDKP